MAISLIQQATGSQLDQREQIKAGVNTGAVPVEDNSFEMMSQRLQAQETPAVGGEGVFRGGNLQRSLSPGDLARLLVQSLGLNR